MASPEEQARELFRNVAEKLQRTVVSETEGSRIDYSFLGELSPSGDCYVITIRLQKKGPQ